MTSLRQWLTIRCASVRWIASLCRHRLSRILAGFAGIMVVLGTWAVVSPVGSDPDGSFHLTSVLCGSGYEPGVCEEFTGDPPTEGRSPVLAPVAATYAGQCFAYQPHQSAACEDGTLHDRTLVYNTSNNLDGLYPNLYYWVNSKIDFNSPPFASYAVRAANITLAALLLLGLRLLGRSPVAHAALLALAVLWVPLGLFLVSSTNPSSWTLIGTGTFWAFLWCSLHEPSVVRSRALLALSVLSGMMAAGSRVDGSLFIALSAVGVLGANWIALTNRKRIVAGVAASFWLLVALFVVTRAGQTQAITSGLSGDGNVPRGVSEVLYQNVVRLPGLFAGVFGLSGFGSGLGWLDTAMPPLTWAVMIALVSALVASLGRPTNRHVRRTMWFLLMMSIALPVYVLFLDRMIVGENVQSRYVLPLLTVVLGVRLAGASADQNLTKRRLIFFSLGLSVAHAAALHTHMRRYISGLDVNTLNLSTGLEWWPSVLPNPNLVWAAASFAMWPLGYAALTAFSRGMSSDGSASPTGITTS